MIFLHEHKHQSLLQRGSIVFAGHSQACPKYPSKFVIPLQYPMTYSARLEERYAGLGAKHFSSFLFSVAFQQKIR